MKIIGGITLHKDYDRFDITEMDMDRAKLKMFNFLLMDKYYKIWTELEQKRDKTEEFMLDNKEVTYLVGLAEPEEDEPEDTKNINNLLERAHMWFEGLNEEHQGDCTNQLHH